MPHISLKDAWRALMLHNARETMLAITVMGWETGRVGVRGSRIILLSSSFNPLEHHQKECLCPENQIDTHREHTPFWLISIITITTTTAAWVAVHFTFRGGDKDIEIENGKDGDCIKEDPHTTSLQCLTSMDFTSCHIWEEDPLVLVGHDYHSL